MAYTKETEILDKEQVNQLLDLFIAKLTNLGESVWNSVHDVITMDVWTPERSLSHKGFGCTNFGVLIHLISSTHLFFLRLFSMNLVS